MASKMGMKASIRRSKSSLNSLSLQSSDASSGFGSSSGRGGSLRSMPMSSSSLYLQGLSETSLSSSSSFTKKIQLDMQLQNSFLSLSSGSLSRDTKNQESSVPGLLPEKGSNLIQWAVILAIALQVPHLLQDIRLILDLHYHSFPVLVVLGSLPTLLKRSRTAHFTSRDQSSATPKDFRTASSLTLDSLDETNSATESTGPTNGEEWGNFIELDDDSGFEPTDTLLIPIRQLTLSTLEEADEEE
jgi:hypothetical protein